MVFEYCSLYGLTNGECAQCQRCRALVGERRTMDAWKAAKLVPPLHPYCRCFLKPVFVEEGGDTVLRRYSVTEHGGQTGGPVLRRYSVTEHGGQPLRGVGDGEMSEKEKVKLEEKRARIELAEVTTSPDGGGFEALLISAGEGNGWVFSSAVLKGSVALWDGAECFVNHDWQHSLRDLAGVFHGAGWDESRQGITARLRLVGPAAGLVRELGEAMLGDGSKPNVGFSADVMFAAQQNQVTEILKVFSVDVVLDPARGGKFLEQFSKRKPEGQAQQTKEGGEMSEIEKNLPKGEGVSAVQAQLESDRKAVEVLLDVQKQQAALNEEAEKARAVRLAMCQHLLESGLGAAKLPQAAAEQVRKQFAGKLFEPGELTQAIEDARKLVSELTGGMVVQGPGRVSGMFTSEDQVSAAMFDLMGAERPEGLKNAKVQKLSGIRELYLAMTGDYDFHGGYNPERVQFAVTTDLPGVLKNALNKLIVMEWQKLGEAGYRWWEKVVKVEHFNSLHDITGVLVGEVTVLPAVAEAADYTSLPVKDSPEVGTFAKYGGYIGLTLEMFERDETHKLRDYPRKLASAGLRRISGLVSSVFTANAGVGPVMADTYNVFEAAHHVNLLTAALAGDKFELASAAIYNQSMLVGTGGTAPKLGLDAKYLLVPRALRLTAMRILYPSFERESNIFSENMQRGQFGDVVTVPEWTDLTDWACVADPNLAPGIIVGERFGLLPEIIVADSASDHALFMADEVRVKARQWVSVFVADYRPLHKSNVT